MLTISAVVPCYDGEEFLAEALGSIAAQTRPVTELIVVDDGSTDRSPAIARAHGATVIEQSNMGEGAARNAGIRAATGDVVASLDADDRWRPHHLETVCGLLEASPGAVAAFGAVQRFGSRTERIPGYIRPGPPVEALHEAFGDWLHTTISSVVRRDALLAVDGFDESERYAVDFDLWLRLARSHRFVATHEVTADWRMHPGQQSATLARQLAAVYRYRRRFLNELHADDDPRALALEQRLNRVWLRDLRRAMEQRDPDVLRTLIAAIRVVRPTVGRG